MHWNLQISVQITTLISVVVGFVSLISTINNFRRQTNVQILMKYTERYEHILDQFPPDALSTRFDSTSLPPPPSPRLTLSVLKYLNLCSEEFYLWRKHYLSEDIWNIWESDLKRMIGSPLLRREWQSLRREFLSHPTFLQFVDEVQSTTSTES